MNRIPVRNSLSGLTGLQELEAVVEMFVIYRDQAHENIAVPYK